jgi:hypothetical protein
VSRRARRIVIAVLAALLAYQVAAYIVDEFTPGGSGGATSSSYATGADGLGAYAELLQRTGHPVSRLRTAPAKAQLDPRTTLVVLDPKLVTSADLTRLRTFVQQGGTLIAGGAASDPQPWLAELTSSAPTWSAGGPTTSTALPGTPYTDGVRTVRSAGDGSFVARAGTLPAVGADGTSLLAVTPVGRGRLLMLSDASPLQDRYLDHLDNAALGVRMAGPAGRPVVFAESIHGYGEASGLAGLPERWKWVLAGLAIAAAVAIASRFRRLGDIDPPEPPVLPPRRAHVEALALALQRTRQPAAAVAPVRGRAHEIVAGRAGLAERPTPEAVLAGARRLGLDDAEARSVAGLDAPDSDGDVLTVGRALAALVRR